MAKTRIIGKVGVRVYPVTEDFHRDAQRELDREAERLKVEVPVKVDEKSSKEQLRDLLRKLKEKAATSEVEVKTRLDQGDLIAKAKQMREEVKRNLGDVQLHTDYDGDKVVKALRGQLRLERLIAKARQDGLSNPGATGTKAIDDLRTQLKLDKQIAKANDDAASAARRQAAEIEKAAVESAKLNREVGKLEFDRDFKRTAEDVKNILGEIDAEVKILDKRMDFKYSVKLEGMSEAERELEDLRHKMTQAENRLELGVDLTEEERRKVIREIDRLRRDIENKTDNLKIGFNLDTPSLAIKYLQIKLARLARDRFVTYIPKVSKVAATNVATSLSAISGARLSKQFISDLGDMVKDLDKAIPKLAAVGTGIAGVAGWALSASANLFSLSAELARIGPAALALPGILGGIAIGAGVTIIALSDLKKQIPGVTAGWKTLTKTIKSNFWEKAKGPIKELGEELFPALRSGIAKTSTEIGNFFAVFATGLRKELGGNPLKNMFADLNKSVEIFTKHAGDIAKIIRILGEEGAGELPRLAGYFGNLTKKFSAFLDKAQKSGALQEWIDNGIQGIKDLGSALYQVGRFLGGLGKIANMAGGTTLAAMADSFRRAGDAIREAHFQELLVGALKAADDMMTRISKISGPGVKAMFEALARTAQVVFPIIGDTIGTALFAVTSALSDPAFQGGLTRFFQGVESFVRALAPAIKPAAQAIGEILDLAGRMATAFGPVLASIITTLSNVVKTIAPYIGQAVTALAGPLNGAIQAVAPAVETIAKAGGPAIKAVADALGQMVKDITPTVGKTFGDIAEFLKKTFQTITPANAKAFADGVGKLATSLLHLIDALIKGQDNNVDGFDLGGMLQRLGDGAGQAAGGVEKLSKQIAPLIKALQDLDAATDPDQFVGGNFNLKDLLLGPNFDEIGNALRSLPATINAGLNAAFQAVIDTTIGREILGPVGTAIVDSLVNGFEAAKQHVQDWLQALTDLIPTWKGPADTDATLLTAAGTAIINGLIAGFKLVDVKGWLSGLTQSIKDKFNGAGDWLRDKGSALIDGLRGGMSSKNGDATGQAQTTKQGIKDKFGNASTWLSAAGGALGTGLVVGLKKKYDDAKTAAKGALDKAKDGTAGANTKLNSAGSSVIDGFVAYIYRGFRKVRDALSSLTALLPSWKGPPSTDKTILNNAGTLVIQGFVDGLKSQFPLVRSTLGSLSKELAKTELAAPTVSAIQVSDLSASRAKVSGEIRGTGDDDPAAGGAVSSGPVFNITNNHPVAEPTSVTITTALRTGKGMGAFE